MSLPQKRMETLKNFKNRGFLFVMFLMPLISLITGTTGKMEEVFRYAKSFGIYFIILSGMTLKEGRQKGYFMHALREYDVFLIPRYLSLYKSNPWGGADSSYYESIHQPIYEQGKKYRIPIRIPVTAAGDCLDQSDRVFVIFEQMDYLLKFLNVRSSCRKTA